MTLAEFRDLVDARGTDIAAWPDQLRIPAERLLAGEPAAQAWLRQARRLDGLIARGVQASSAPADAAAARVLNRMARQLPPQRRFAVAWPAALLEFDLAPARLRIAALVAVACLGVAIGLFAPDLGAGEGTFVIASASSDSSLAAVFEPEPLTGVRP
jgi:hypothetical protein